MTEENKAKEPDVFELFEAGQKEAQAVEPVVEDVKAEEPAPEAEVTAEPAKVEEAPVEPQIDPAEVEAREKGWKPESEFDGDETGKKFVSAQEFLDREQFYDTISKQNRKIKQMEETMANFADHKRRSEQAAYERALKDLSAQKVEAVEEGDVDRVKSLDDEQMQLIQQQTAYAAQEQAQHQAELTEATMEFQKRNPWCRNDAAGEEKAMTVYAQTIGNQLDQQYPHLSIDEGMKIVEEEVKKAFPHRFENANQTKPSAVAPAARKVESKGRHKPSMLDIPEEYRKSCKEFCSMIPGYTEEQYVQDLIDQGVIEND